MWIEFPKTKKVAVHKGIVYGVGFNRAAHKQTVCAFTRARKPPAQRRRPPSRPPAAPRGQQVKLTTVRNDIEKILSYELISSTF